MSWPTIVECYDDIVEDPYLLQLFLEKEWTSIQKLPLLHTLQFRIILERLFACIASPAIWRKARMEFVTSSGPKISGKATAIAILVTDGVGGRKPGHGDHLLWPWSIQDGGFWCTLYPTSMQPTGAKCGCSEELHQHSLYPLGGLPSPLSRHEHTLWGSFLHPVPTGQAISMQIAPLLWHWGGLALRRGRDGVGSVSPFLRGSMAKLRRGEPHLWSNFIVVPLLAPHPYWEEGTQTEGRLGFHPALKLLQDASQAWAPLECELVQETQELACQYDDRQIKQARRHKRWQAWMVE